MSEITLTQHQGHLAEAMFYINKAKRAIDQTDVGQDGEWSTERHEAMDHCDDALAIVIEQYQETE